MASPVLVIHGGAGSKALTADRVPVLQASIAEVLREVYPLLVRGGTALTAVVEAVRLLEDDPLFNAGRGSKIQQDGKIRMSASLMDGTHRQFSGCVNVEGVKNPICLAKKLLTNDDRVLAGMGAALYAKSHGLEFASPYTEKARAEYKAAQSGKTETVGAVALDSKGRLAAATSTGGRGFEIPHRVSDSPTVAGNFASRKAAVSVTGRGEQIVDFAVASTVCTLVDAKVPLSKAVRNLLAQARKEKAGFGLIALDAKGNIVASGTTPTLIWGSVNRKGLVTFSS